MAPKKHRVFLVDDHPIVRQGLALLIDQEPDLTVCGTAANARSALEAIPKTNPHIVLTDLSMPGPDGLELITELHAQMPALFILALSMHDEMLYAERALKSGARGYIMKHEVEGNIMTAIRRVLQGQVYLSAAMTRHFLRKVGERTVLAASTLDILSNRELQIFALLGHGRRTTEIAQELSIGIKTVETHMGRIRHKLSFSNSHELARQAVIWVQRKLSNQ